MQVTFNDVRIALIDVLEDAFPAIAVTDEAPGESMIAPYLSVQMTEPSHTHELNRRYYRTHPFVIRYVSPQPTSGHLCDMTEQLTEALRSIPVAGRPVFGTQMRFETIEQVLHCHVNYNFHVWAPKQGDSPMQTLDVQEGIK